MDFQVASLKTLLESLKLETIRYLAGKHQSSLDGQYWVLVGFSDTPECCCVTPQRRCSPAWPSLWEFTACGGNGSTGIYCPSNIVEIIVNKIFIQKKKSTFFPPQPTLFLNFTVQSLSFSSIANIQTLNEMFHYHFLPSSTQFLGQQECHGQRPGAKL